MSEAQEIRLGQGYAPQVAAQIGLYPDEELQRYVEGLAMPMAQRSERPTLPWQFRVLDDPAVNAFAVPGGFIYVTRGILAHMNSEAELVAVLGHEIGHVTARHSVSQMSRQQLAQIGLIVGAVMLPEEYRGLAQLAGAGAQVLFLKYGRDDESESDALGYRYMTEASYDPNEMVALFETLQRTTQAAGGARVPEWLSTHPWPENRETAVRAMIAADERDHDGKKVGREAFLQRLDGMVFGADPRGGWFAGSRFHHPSLRFRVDFPDGWRTANQAQAVLAVSPEQDAIVRLTLSGADSLEQAARQFASQQGLQLEGGTFQRASLSGLPAAAARFRAQTQQGVLGGTVVLVEHGERIYQLMGFAPSQVYARRARVLEAAISSFQRETDPKVLGAKAWRIDLVAPDRRLTIDEFARFYPGPVSADALARINGKDPGELYEPGVVVKRVVGEPLPGTEAGIR